MTPPTALFTLDKSRYFRSNFSHETILLLGIEAILILA